MKLRKCWKIIFTVVILIVVCLLMNKAAANDFYKTVESWFVIFLGYFYTMIKIWG